MRKRLWLAALAPVVTGGLVMGIGVPAASAAAKEVSDPASCVAQDITFAISNYGTLPPIGTTPPQNQGEIMSGEAHNPSCWF